MSASYRSLLSLIQFLWLHLPACGLVYLYLFLEESFQKDSHACDSMCLQYDHASCSMQDDLEPGDLPLPYPRLSIRFNLLAWSSK
ncbi:unnamed protein product [Linum trigynum]|uniref:Uncharacterized protein n=1 Tax=Linum trigynum TaxID=586398 RepID=A0AAV2D0U2_9ROSI